MSSIEFEASLKSVLAELDKLPTKIETKLARGALRASAKPIYQRARENVPVASGDLRRSIRISSKINRKAGEVVVKVKAGNKKAWYAHILEGGAVPHTIKGPVLLGGRVYRNLHHPGIKGRAFMRRAYDATAQACVDAFADYMKKNIPKALAKNGSH